MMYKKYSTALKVYVSLNMEKEKVKPDLLLKIPKSTIQYWKNKESDYAEKIIGYNLEEQLNKDLDKWKCVYHPANQIPLKTFMAFSQLLCLIVSFFEKKLLQKHLRANKTKFIQFISDYNNELSIKKLSKLLNISDKTIYYWKQQIQFTCNKSPFSLCVKRHPNQATKQEVEVIQKYLNDSKYAHWGIQNIWAKAFKENHTKLSKYAWYHYNKLLKIRKNVSKGKKHTYQPIIASKVNEIWHADITVFKTLDGMKHYIYTVMDNFSRYIISWRIETVVSAKIRLETIKDAIQNAFDGKIPKKQIQFITDGGPENDNITLKKFMNQNQSYIKHDIALKDIVQSNSMAEAFYSTAKYRYLYLQKILNREELLAAFKYLLNEYQLEKPHYALGIYTPSEVFNGQIPKNNFTETFVKAAAERRKINKLGCDLSCES